MSRVQELLCEGAAVWLLCVPDTVVHAAGLPLPKLNPQGLHNKPAPVGWPLWCQRTCGRLLHLLLKLVRQVIQVIQRLGARVCVCVGNKEQNTRPAMTNKLHTCVFEALL